MGSCARKDREKGVLLTEAAPSARLTACLIVRDEEVNLPRALNSLRGVADEVIVVDTGSTDRTREIAAESGAKVFEQEWQGDFSLARNCAMDKASGEWILILDADEEVAAGQGELFKELLVDQDHAGFFANIENIPQERPGAPPSFVSPSIRMFRNHPDHRYKGAVHEQIQISRDSQGGKVAFTDLRLRHYGYSEDLTVQADRRNRNIELLSKAAAADPDDAYTLYCLGNEYMAGGDFDKAASALGRALELLPEEEQVYAPSVPRNLALCLRQSGRPDKALEVLAETQRRYPRFTDLVYLEGVIALERQDFPRAVQLFAQCLDMGTPPAQFESWGGVGTYGALTGLGHALRAQGDEGRATEVFKEALKANPAECYALRQLGELLLKKHAAHRVADELEALADLRSQEVLRTLIELFSETGNAELAAEWRLKMQVAGL